MNNEIAVRLGAFAGVFLLVALAERLRPRRQPSTPRAHRWAANLALTALNPLLLRLVFPVLAVDLALQAQQRGWGILNQLPFAAGLKWILAVLALDLVIYLQHVMFHALPLCWRLHMVHHADLDYDVTTGLRFHPIEIVLSMIIKLAAVLLLGAAPQAVVIFEVLLNATSMFNHANLNLPLGLDRVLRLVLVTPDMHRVHHSVIIRETNSNFGFNLPWWDQLFGTYRAQPSRGHPAMTIGLAQYRDPAKLTLPHLLALPLTGETGRQPLGRL